MQKINILIAASLFFSLSSVNAQKLLSIQQAGLRASKNIKIDGNAADWGEHFQALNHNIDAYYSIANDDENLYLIVKPIDAIIAKKAIAGGIVFSISEKKNVWFMGVGSPLIEGAAQSEVIARYSDYEEAAGSKAHIKKKDSLLVVANKALNNASKELALGGIKEINYNTISLYNEYGIKEAILFDKSGSLIYELAIPLKYLKSVMKDKSDFAYNLMIKGMSNRAKIVTTKKGDEIGITDVPISMTKGGVSAVDLLMNSTDFWGIYTLAK